LTLPVAVAPSVVDDVWLALLLDVDGWVLALLPVVDGWALALLPDADGWALALLPDVDGWAPALLPDAATVCLAWGFVALACGLDEEEACYLLVFVVAAGFVDF